MWGRNGEGEGSVDSGGGEAVVEVEVESSVREGICALVAWAFRRRRARRDCERVGLVGGEEAVSEGDLGGVGFVSVWGAEGAEDIVGWVGGGGVGAIEVDALNVGVDSGGSLRWVKVLRSLLSWVGENLDGVVSSCRFNLR